MVFSSIIFIFSFLPISLLLYYVMPHKFKNITLLLISLVFYAWGEPVYVLLMIFTTIFDYIMAIIIDKNREDKLRRKILFIVTVIVNLLGLSFFKYYGFLVNNINTIFNLNIQSTNLSLPIGISFYTFQTLSYIIDVYKGKVKVQKNLILFGLYVCMFPQLVAGPIVRYSDINEQLKKRDMSIEKFSLGVDKFIRGLTKKVLLANNIGILWTTIQQSEVSQVSVLTLWVGMIAYHFQIYFDFSGYSDMAIGLGKMFGFDFIENFDYPYTSTSITQFWRKWHISLGTWFREYVYIPLGGNRVNKSRFIINIFVVWFLTGFWHGANWNFIIWGIYYGLILLLEKTILKNVLQKLPILIKHTYTMILVIVGWILFANENLSLAFNYLKIMFLMSKNTLIDNTSIYYIYTNISLFIVLSLCSTPVISKIFDNIIKKGKLPGIIFGVSMNLVVVLLSIAYLVNETYNPFLYFKF